ncbi:MAG: hypothetical protein SFW36_12490 [Leptolyngbyaceae cyanobacterium bins.59]|nr:hypothetical protein [Leptolyngbyaceae cyanobacterium bins.59]
MPQSLKPKLDHQGPSWPRNCATHLVLAQSWNSKQVLTSPARSQCWLMGKSDVVMLLAHRGMSAFMTGHRAIGSWSCTATQSGQYAAAHALRVHHEIQ